MTISAADLAKARDLAATVPEHDAVDMSVCDTIEEVIALTIANARQDGDDEVHTVELLIRLAEMTPTAVRRSERMLRPLGYVAVADMMRRITGRRKHSLIPLA
jgi:tRNA A58 N-methylase Trm61